MVDLIGKGGHIRNWDYLMREHYTSISKGRSVLNWPSSRTIWAKAVRF